MGLASSVKTFQIKLGGWRRGKKDQATEVEDLGGKPGSWTNWGTQRLDWDDLKADNPNMTTKKNRKRGRRSDPSPVRAIQEELGIKSSSQEKR